MLAAIIFISCNIDGLLLLMVLLCTPTFPVKSVFVGQFLSQVILILISAALAHLALNIPPAYVGLAGLLPITLGALKLFDRHKWQCAEPLNQQSRIEGNMPWQAVGSTTALALSNGGDNLSVYVPVFTMHPPSTVLLMSAVFLVMTAVWCWLAWYLAYHPWIGRVIRQYSQTLLPWNMIALGIYVLSGSVRHLLPVHVA